MHGFIYFYFLNKDILIEGFCIFIIESQPLKLRYKSLALNLSICIILALKKTIPTASEMDTVLVHKTKLRDFRGCEINYYSIEILTNSFFFLLQIGDREKFSLPDDMPVMHFEYTQFYYPGNMDFPRKYQIGIFINNRYLGWFMEKYVLDVDKTPNL